MPLVEGYHCSTTLFHLVCSAKVDTREGTTVHKTLNEKVIESGLAQKENTLVEKVKSKFNDVNIDEHLQKMLTDAAEPHNILHETVHLKVLFFTRQVQENDNEVDSAVVLKQIELFLVNKSKEISKGKTGSAVLPGSVQLGRQLEILLGMLHDGKRNKLTDIVRYTGHFGNDCQNPFTLENNNMWPEEPTYLSWDQFWDTFHDTSQQNIQILVSRFGLKTTRRPEISNVYPNQEE